jgi:hypothetical protein
LAFNADGSFTYTPMADYVGSDTFSYQAEGSNGNLSSPAVVTIHVDYQFNGFLSPLGQGRQYAVGRTIPIKFELTDYNGSSITSLSAITSLQVVDAQGTNVMTNAGSTTLRYDPTSNQFVANWQSRGLPAGNYTVQLVLADGTTKSQTVQLVASKGAFQLADGASSGYVSSTSNQILFGVLTVALQDDTGNSLDTNQVGQISDAMTYLNAALGSFGVNLSWAAPGTAADVHIHFASSTPYGGAGDGVLGFTTAENDVYFVTTGWNFNTGADPSQIGAGQYDFLTLATHELAHTVGLGESSDPGSVMYEYLSAGRIRRTFTDSNLALINTDADRFMKVGGDLLNAGHLQAVGKSTQAGSPTAFWQGGPLVLDPWSENPLGRMCLPPASAMQRDGYDARIPGLDGDDRVLMGGAGSDLIIGGQGRNLMVGGFGLDHVAKDGGDNSDAGPGFEVFMNDPLLGQ